MKLDVLKTTFANFQRPQNLQVHSMFLNNLFHLESPYTGCTLKMVCDPIPGVCNWKNGELEQSSDLQKPIHVRGLW